MANESEKKEDGIGLVDGTAAVVGGAALGGLATKAMVTRSVKSNLGEIYSKELKKQAEGLNATALFSDGAAEGLQLTAQEAGSFEAQTTARRAEIVKDSLAHSTHEAVKGAAPEAEGAHKALFDAETSLGKARAADITHQGTDAYRTTAQAAATETHGKLVAGATAVDAATGAARTAAEKQLLDTVVQQVEHQNNTAIARKVGNLSWTQRLNPFSAELHLSGGQKALAIAAGTAAVIVGAVATGRLARWVMGSGDKEQGPSK